MKITVSRRCGNIAFELGWQPDPDAIPARARTCSLCVKHGGAWTSNPQGSLAVTVKDPARLPICNWIPRVRFAGAAGAP